MTPAEVRRPAEVIVHNALVLDGDPATFTPEFADHWIALGGGVVVARGRGEQWTHVPTSADAEIVDAGGAYLAPAFIDIHTHGAGGASAEDGVAGLEAILGVHRAHGTGRLALSYVSNTFDGLCASLREGAALVRENSALLGLHAEGPFLSSDFCGAHAPEVLTAPTPEAVEAILEAAGGALAQITIAPELPGAAEAIARFVDAGVTVAVGHTAIDHDGAARAFDAGASLLTHAFNAMPGIHHRAPGPVLAAVESGHVTLELINDGVHVHAPVARMLTELAPGRTALVTDAMAATGMGDGSYRLGTLDVTVEAGVARLVTADGAPGAIAGSTLTMDVAVRRAVAEVGLSPLDAVRAASLIPLRALGRVPAGTQSLLTEGGRGAAVLLDRQMRLQRTFLTD